MGKIAFKRKSKSPRRKKRKPRTDYIPDPSARSRAPTTEFDGPGWPYGDSLVERVLRLESAVEEWTEEMRKALDPITPLGIFKHLFAVKMYTELHETVERLDRTVKEIWRRLESSEQLKESPEQPKKE